MMFVEFKEYFLLAEFVEFKEYFLLDSYFLDMMYVEFMKNFLLADSCELIVVRFISISLAQKRLIPTF